VLIEIQELERRKVRFEETFPVGALHFPETDWRQVDEVRAEGMAELLDPSGSRTVRVCGHIRANVEGACARCLDAAVRSYDDDFELFYHPMAVIAKNESVAIGPQDTEAGFYELPGISLADVLTEQILLWLPMRSLCRDDCQGICPVCGANRNLAACGCELPKGDTRWDALKSIVIEN
jgi:uncharacterized protein